MGLSQSGVRPVDPILQGMVVGALQPKGDFIAREALPVIPVAGAAATGQVFVEETAEFMGDPSVGLARAPGAAFVTINNDDPTTVTYSCTGRGAKTPPLPKEFVKRSQLSNSLKSRNAAVLARALMVQEDVDAAALLFGAGIGWALTSSVIMLPGGGGIQWNAAGATPLTDLDIQKVTARENANGLSPRDMVIGIDVMDALRRSPEIRGLYIANPFAAQLAVASGSKILSVDAVKTVLTDVLGVQNIYVGAARRRTPVPGAAVTTYGNIWGDSVWMGHLSDAETAITAPGGNIRVQATAAAMIVEDTVEANTEWDPNVQSWWSWSDESYDILALNLNLGSLVQDCLV